jgi:hypothetical protein
MHHSRTAQEPASERENLVLASELTSPPDEVIERVALLLRGFTDRKPGS